MSRYEKEEGYQINKAQLRKAIVAKLACEPEDVLAVNYTTSAGSNRGENFICVLFAVEVLAKIKGRDETLHFMVKCLPVSEGRVKFANELQAFQKECVVYAEIIPKYQELRAKVGLSKLQVPGCYLADSKNGIIIMENLRKRGYGLFNKLSGQEMSVDIAEKLLSQVASFHATGFHFLKGYKNNSNSGAEAFVEDFPNMSFPGWLLASSSEWQTKNDANAENQIAIIRDTIKRCCSQAEDCDNLVARLESFQPKSNALVREHLAPSSADDGFNTLVHNDVHMNNVMYTVKDDGGADKLMLLDLQMIKYARPTVDLAYFFGSSSSATFRAEHLDHLLKFYYAYLMSELQTFGYSPDIYTYEKFSQDYQDTWVFGFSSACMHIQLENSAMAADFDPEDFHKDEESYNRIMKVWYEKQMESAESNKPYLQKVLGLVREAADKNII